MSTYKIGIDTGGTYTDAVLMQDNQVIAKAKSLTTRDDLSIGIRGALSQILPTDLASIEFVALSTTLATNGLIEKQGGRTALFLIGFDESPLPRAGLVDALGGDPVFNIAGGHNAGGDPKAPLDIEALDAAIAEVKDKVDAIAVNSFFAVRNPAHEMQAIERIGQQCGLPVSAGHQLSSALDAPKRAVTSVINARLIPLIGSLMQACQGVMIELGVAAPLMVVKGDGSLIRASAAELTPVETILSGPAASVVGAQYLCGDDHCVVADMGGTTLDIAYITDGQPKLSDQGAIVGGYQTRVRAVEVHTSGLGGDSWIQFDRLAKNFAFGPKRAVPLALLALDYPDVIETMQKQLERGWPVTHDGQFARRRPNRGDIKAMSSKQRSIWAQMAELPLALTDLFKDQTLDKPLLRLVDRDWVALSAFTPTDAAHVLGLADNGNSDAAILAARIAMRYSNANYGPKFDDLESFCQFIIERVSLLSAERILDATLAHELGLDHPLPTRYRDITLKQTTTQSFEFGFKLNSPLVGIGAPSHTYLPNSADTLNCQYIKHEHAAVANAIGAVVGLVRAECNAVITPLPNDRFRLHCKTYVDDFTSLEAAAEAANNWMQNHVADIAGQNGATDLSFAPERKDIVVTEGDQSIFFESRLRMVATGRPAF
ncbi:MAG: hydantoinase/oxoprolinase family protein [Gammaproteobacteria bacterium]|nr:hydantoinase/oxoprolinase family protein [Gammaproteobacteria bacterium]